MRAWVVPVKFCRLVSRKKQRLSSSKMVGVLCQPIEKGATMTHDHRKPEVAAAQERLLDEADFLREIVQRVLQEVLEAQMTEHIGAAPYERTDARKGHLNGHMPRALKTRVGTFGRIGGWCRNVSDPK
jgi:Transposase, Mutator family